MRIQLYISQQKLWLALKSRLIAMLLGDQLAYYKQVYVDNSRLIMGSMYDTVFVK